MKVKVKKGGMLDACTDQWMHVNIEGKGGYDWGIDLNFSKLNPPDSCKNIAICYVGISLVLLVIL